MKNLFLAISLLSLTGCQITIKSDQQACVDKIKEMYCKPNQVKTNNGMETIYDCTQVKNEAFDAAVKVCMEIRK